MFRLNSVSLLLVATNVFFSSRVFPQPTLVFFDTFNRIDSLLVGNGWREIENSSVDAQIKNGRLVFPTNHGGVAYRDPGTIGDTDITLTWTYLKTNFTGDLDAVSVRHNGVTRGTISDSLALVINWSGGEISLWDQNTVKAAVPFRFFQNSPHNFQWSIFRDNRMLVWVWYSATIPPPTAPLLSLPSFVPVSRSQYWALGNRLGATFDNFKVWSPAAENPIESPDVEPIPPLPPDNLSALLRTSQSAGISWVDNAQNETGFVLERKLIDLGAQGEGAGGAEDWTQIGETGADTTMYIDPVLPPNTEATYRIAAKNANGTSSKVLSQPITTPDSRWQLKLYDSATQKWVDLKRPSQFHPDWGTAVIVHGWQLPDFNPMNSWVLDMARAIHSRLNGVSKQANIIAWDWVEEATAPLPGKPAEHVDTESKELADLLQKTFPNDYKGPIHFIGHSLGCHIITLTALHLHIRHPAFKDTFPPTQITLLDTPDWGVGDGNLTKNVTYLRSKGVYVDSYASCTNLYSHNAHIRIDVPCFENASCGQLLLFCHFYVHDWYQNTIDKTKISLRKNIQCGPEDLGGNIGFDASVLLASDPTQPEELRVPLGQCENEGTLEFSYLTKCSRLVPEDVFGLTNPNKCRTNKLPAEEQVTDLTAGTFWSGDEFQCDGCAYKTSTDAILKTNRQGQGGGAGIEQEELTARYTLDLLIEPEWDSMGFEYDFIRAPSPSELEVTLIDGENKHSLLHISSEIVFNEGYLDSGLRNIHEFHGKNMRLQIDLRSNEPDAEVSVRNITFWKDAYHGNELPVANAGEDQVFTVNCNERVSVTLDGSSSYDPDGDALEYQWFYQGGVLATGTEQTLEFFPGDYTLALVVRDTANNTATDDVKVTITAQCPFIRGDSNIDGVVDISDAINTLGFLFTGKGDAPCKDASDTNDDGIIDISDAIYLLGFLFTGVNKTIPQPHPDRGDDLSSDELNCNQYGI